MSSSERADLTGARVWSTDHNPRYEITLRLDALPVDIAVNDPRTDGGAAHGEGHVHGYTRRGTGSNRISMNLPSGVGFQLIATA